MKRIFWSCLGLYAFFFFLASEAEAIRIDDAEIKHGVVKVDGDRAARRATIFWEGAAVTESDRRGRFEFKTTNLPLDCVGELSDGVKTIDVVVKKCTTVQGGEGEVAATGQTTCDQGDSTLGDCATGSPEGQDGDFQAGVPLPSPRFTVNGDGTITDNLTGLIWLKDAECFGSRTWAQALSDANALANGTCGLTDGSIAGDWHLPNRNELASLVHLGFVSPALSDAAGAGQWTTAMRSRISSRATGLRLLMQAILTSRGS